MAVKRTKWQRFVDFLFLRVSFAKRAPEPPLLNDIHDLAENRSRQEPILPTSNTADLLKLQEQVETMNASLQDLFRLSDRVNTLYGVVDGLRKEFLNFKLSQNGGADPSPKRNYDDLSGSSIEPSRSSTQQLGRSQSRSVSSRSSSREPTIDELDRAVCQALERQTAAGIEIDNLLAEIRDQIGDFRIDVEYVGQGATGRWQIAALLLPSTGQGVAIVSPGGLAGPEVVSFFEVEFGRRIFACTQPARVVRNGQQISVSRKGRVESS